MDQISSFKTGWILGVELPGYREEGPDGEPSSYEELPPLDETRFDGTLQWLYPTPKDSPPAVSADRQTLANLASPPAHLRELVFSAEHLRLTLPEPFLSFMALPVLQEAIFACSADWVDSTAKIVPCPGHQEGYIIRFLNDQQDCEFWYLYLIPKSQVQYVLVSHLRLDPEEDETYRDPEGPADLADAIFLCAPTFETFLYRYWLECNLVGKLAWSPPEPLTSEEQGYLAHYKRSDKH
jgi:hypothetical protein